MHGEGTRPLELFAWVGGAVGRRNNKHMWVDARALSLLWIVVCIQVFGHREGRETVVEHAHALWESVS